MTAARFAAYLLTGGLAWLALGLAVGAIQAVAIIILLLGLLGVLEVLAVAVVDDRAERVRGRL